MTGMKDTLGDTPFPYPERPAIPHPSRAFDGPEYQLGRDFERLSGQVLRIFNLMKDGRFRTLEAIANATGDPAASISAQLRHLRKEKFGSHTVNRQHLGNGLYQYQLIVKAAAA
jgi:hypothetical protein